MEKLIKDASDWFQKEYDAQSKAKCSEPVKLTIKAINEKASTLQWDMRGALYKLRTLNPILVYPYQDPEIILKKKLENFLIQMQDKR